MAALEEIFGRIRARRAAPAALSVPDGLDEVFRDGAVPLAAGADPASGRLELAWIIPSFSWVTGGHMTIATLVRELERRGHACSIWLADDAGPDAARRREEAAKRFTGSFGAVAAPVHASFANWRGADVVLATGWQTVPRALRLPGARARAYLVQDHEPEFFPTSMERRWAEWGYAQGLYPIVASAWLAEELGRRYGLASTRFDLGVDHARYRPAPAEERADRVVFYARASTPRRAVPLGMLALAELHRRRPQTELVLFGDGRRLHAPFPRRDLGVLAPPALSELYRSATAGLVLSLTNPSLVPHEMLACGLPCVDIEGESTRRTYGPDSPVVLAAPEPAALAEGLAALLDAPPAERAARAAAGVAKVAPMTWERAGGQVEDGLQAALAAARR